MPVVIDGRVYYRPLELCKKANVSRSTLLRWLKEGILKSLSEIGGAGVFLARKIWMQSRLRLKGLARVEAVITI